LTEKEGAEKAFAHYKRWIDFHLARLIPYKRNLTEQLKTDERFIETCQWYGLTFDEGINVVRKCPKIGYEWASHRLSAR